MSDTFEDAKEQVHAWKPNEIRKAGVELVQAGLRALLHDADYFGPDDIPEDVSFGTTGAVGIATRMLISANVIKPSYIHLPAKGIHYGQRKSQRTPAHSRVLRLYSLVSRGIAEAWLERNDVEIEPLQPEFALAI